ncbi:Capsule polysaccharide export protein KpsC [uncultured Pleomorphomonas sp.]|uniref:Capsule polysaccharide export protein KpsC n=1 Tax=uncultured Pleomorphomonas sp. TaxID=442121 RepID=A0A212LGE5_9HYPH|nr:capsular polysaccharide biosynthesis protein [uncultured Pleomorphomonas sp.]SCM76459.1 Capsule polysaccharide export protein KpsC [uncultured Pleomorphomonas sp.]
MVGWGRKVSGQRAMETAAKIGASVLLLEDGFLRSVERDDPSLSVVLDTEGIYYDATASSTLESLIARSLTEEERQRAQRLMAAWRRSRLSKYNFAREYQGELPERYVLLIDQVAGDLSIARGLADAASFARLLDNALAENPDLTVVVKVHPDIRVKARAGHFDIPRLEAMARVRVVDEPCHPVRLIEGAEAVYTVTSQVGFEALIWGKRVRCLGMPFYAGWGLTEDDVTPPARRTSVSLEQLVFAALVRYPRYVDPERCAPCEAETAMAHIALQREMRSRFPSVIHAVGFSAWKKPILTRFLAGSKLIFVRSPDAVPEQATVAVWGAETPQGLPASAKVLHVEDGFLRSSGLGADLVRPMSWVIDDLGIYYDATRPSRLERVLQTTEFDADLLRRAEALRATIVAEGVTKYNLAGRPWRRPIGDRRVILVPGQVETDASIRLGGVGIRTNLALLKAVRAANPEAYIVYKPHPDVVSGLRSRGGDEAEAPLFSDEIVTDGDTLSMLAEVDEVHTITSLMGFEALIRELTVVCYGQPFYAGWGLTRDVFPNPRRTRRLSIGELVAAALIIYPSYVSHVTNAFTCPERIIEELSAWRRRGPSTMPLWRRGLRFFLRLWSRRQGR